MRPWTVIIILIVNGLWLTDTPLRSEEQTRSDAYTISGIVVELRSGTPDVIVFLCDSATGLPLANKSFLPIDWGKNEPMSAARDLAIAATDEKGMFRFEHVPAGTYRLAAQKWIGPYKNVFAEHGTVIQLMGTADKVVVPRPTVPHEAILALSPAGDRIVQFDQDVGNNDTFMFLSTASPEFDPILGLNAMGKSFCQQLIGVNRMPLGKTTVIGVPDQTVHAFFFAPDNSPGFATIEVPVSDAGLSRILPEPFVAGWSDGRKTPSPNIAKLMELMDQHSLLPEQLLNLPVFSNANAAAYRARVQELENELSREIELVEGTSARTGDILAAMKYRMLMR